MAKDARMSASNDKIRDVTSSIDKLRVSSTKSKKVESEPVESWEDESSDTETAKGVSTPERPSTSDLPRAPPPTPFSPARQREQIASQGSLPDFNFVNGTFETSSADTAHTASTRGEDKRPEKTTAVASRLIAAGIGQRAPRRTEEERKYDQAMKIQEKKKRDQAREAEAKKKLEAEHAKKAIWDD